MPLRILTSSYTLDWAGVPTYTKAMADELERRGHTVEVYSPKSGPMATEFTTVHQRLNGVAPPDIILAQHNKCAVWMRGAFPSTPMIFSAHGVLPDIEQPPRQIHVDWYTAINEQVVASLTRQHIPVTTISILRDFVDLDRFVPTHPLRPTRPRVLFVSNYKKWKNYDMVETACAQLDWDLTAVGSPYGRVRRPMWDVMNEHDLIVSWGRGILEGMACGRCVVSFDKELGDGYLDDTGYWDSRTRNFSGYECRIAFTADRLADELRWYDPADGPRNRGLVEQEHGQVVGVDELLRVMMRVVGD